MNITTLVATMLSSLTIRYAIKKYEFGTDTDIVHHLIIDI